MNRKEFKEAVINDFLINFKEKGIVKTKTLVEHFENRYEGKNAGNCLYQIDKYKIGFGKYNADLELVKNSNTTANTSPEVVETTSYEDEGIIPSLNSLYVKFGFHSKLKSIISTGMFYPVYISGLSGNGKTEMVQQVCAELKRELVRVNLTIETDEDDLIGSYKLKNGSTIFEYGPVILAMKKGAVLLLDEVTSALDPELVGEVLSLIKDLKGTGTTILMATHELSFAREVADWVIFLENGKILEQGEAKEFFDNPKQPRTKEFLTRMIKRTDQ
jgi:ABC-type uncharacterized transport system ATPase subunit